MQSYISPQGYSIVKDSITAEQLESIKNDLTVKPHVYNGEANAFKVYQEGPTKIYVPKFYGLSKFGSPITNKLDSGSEINLKFAGSLRPIQKDAVASFLKATKEPHSSGGLLNLTCASGKCLGRNTPVLMYSGYIKKVQDIEVGDQLMGDDGKPRTVLSTCSGWEALYKINQTKGISYIVNSSHILSLMYNDKPIDISLGDYLKHPDRLLMQGYKKFVGFPEFPCKRCPREMGRMQIPLGPNSEKNMLAYVEGAFESGPVSSNNSKFIEDLCFAAHMLGFELDIIEEKLYIGARHIGHIAYNIEVTYETRGEYFGFLIDGNHRFLLGDATVTHNTVMAIYLICEIGRKSLIVVHKDFLLEQWRERIAQFAPDAKVGLIKAKTVDVEDKDIVLASLQSLSMKEYPKNLFADFGLVVIDEVHHTSAEVFSRALRKVAFKYTLGLSATIRRKDGLTKVFKWFLGDVLYSNVKSSKKDIVHIDCRYYYVPCPAYSEEFIYKKLNIAKMINNICEFEPRLEFIGNLVIDVFAKEPERRMIILSDRRGHLERLGEWLSQNGISCGFYLGGMRITDLKESEQKQAILGTYCMVSEGFDCKHLDTLVLASPKSDVVQSVGRILRLEAHERKHTPLVIDVIDKFSIFARQGFKRLTYYKTQKYVIVGEQSLRGDTTPIAENCIIRDLE